MKKPKAPKPIYLDSAATTRQKPPQVLKAVARYAAEVGVSHGRGTYRAGIQANELVYGTRASLARLFHIQRSERILYMKNVTEGINTALQGVLQRRGHGVLSDWKSAAS